VNAKLPQFLRDKSGVYEGALIKALIPISFISLISFSSVHLEKREMKEMTELFGWTR